MEKLIIHGGKTLKGEVNISGAKNSALPLMAASLLAPGAHQLTNVPSLRDVTTMISLLSHLGIECQQDGDKLTLQHTKLTANNAPYDLVRTMRASVLVMGPLLAKFRHAKISLPGGCAIGARPIDLHLKALEQMGAKVELHDGYVEVFADKLHSATIHFDKITVTGTENIMMAAVFTNGKTLLKNAAREPEIIDLANYLNKMGAKITGAGTDCISIEGVNELTASSHSVIADRIEAGTFIIAAGITGSEITLQNCPTALLETEIAKLKTAGLCFEPSKNSLLVKGPKQAISVNMSTQAHPGFATDLQAQFMALMSVANSTSVITENIFENRFMHVPELCRMGAKISCESSTAVIKGQATLKGAPVMATDLRASACLVLAGLAAKGCTEVNRVYHLDRGYEKMDVKLNKLGAQIERTS